MTVERSHAGSRSWPPANERRSSFAKPAMMIYMQDALLGVHRYHVHGRKRKSALAGKRSAVKAARYVWRGALEKGLLKQYLVGCLPYGDIRACFDELDHQVLAHILRKKIQDERFLNLIRKLLKAGY